MGNPVTSGQVSLPPQGFPALAGWGGQGNGTGAFTAAWNLFFQGIFNRTGGGSGAPTLNPQSAPSGIASSPLMLVPGVNFVDTAAGLNGYAQLPAGLNSGQWVVVVNKTASAQLNVLPPSGAQIDALGMNAPYALNTSGAAPTHTVQLFWFENGQQCWSTILG